MKRVGNFPAEDVEVEAVPRQNGPKSEDPVRDGLDRDRDYYTAQLSVPAALYGYFIPFARSRTTVIGTETEVAYTL